MALSATVISSDKVEGTTVYNAAGDKLGTIDDLMIDKMSGQVRYAVMEFGGFLGMGTDRYPIPWAALKYDTGKDGYVVPLDKATLDGARSMTTAACFVRRPVHHQHQQILRFLTLQENSGKARGAAPRHPIDG